MRAHGAVFSLADGVLTLAAANSDAPQAMELPHSSKANATTTKNRAAPKRAEINALSLDAL